MNKEELENEAVETLTTIIRRTTSLEYQIAAAKALLEHLRNKKENKNDTD